MATFSPVRQGLFPCTTALFSEEFPQSRPCTTRIWACTTGSLLAPYLCSPSPALGLRVVVHLVLNFFPGAHPVRVGAKKACAENSEEDFSLLVTFLLVTFLGFSGPHLNPVTINPVIRMSRLGPFSVRGIPRLRPSNSGPGACNPCFEAQNGRPRRLPGTTPGRANSAKSDIRPTGFNMTGFR